MIGLIIRISFSRRMQKPQTGRSAPLPGAGDYPQRQNHHLTALLPSRRLRKRELDTAVVDLCVILGPKAATSSGGLESPVHWPK